MSKKRKITLGVLAVILVLCLWYTRPRSFEDLAGGGKIDNISAIAVVTDFSSGLADMRAWAVDSYEGQDTVIGDLEEILNSCKYRASLWSLFTFLDRFRDSYEIPGDKIGPHINLVAVLEDGSTVVAEYRGATVTLTADNRIIAKGTDKEIGDKLAAYIQESGYEL